jgi:hypothetical protein
MSDLTNAVASSMTQFKSDLLSAVTQQIQGLKQDRRTSDLKRPYHDAENAKTAAMMAALWHGLEAGGTPAVEFLLQLFLDSIRSIDEGAAATTVWQSVDRQIANRFAKALADGVVEALHSSTSNATNSAKRIKKSDDQIDNRCIGCGKTSHTDEKCWKLHPDQAPKKSFQLMPPTPMQMAPQLATPMSPMGPTQSQNQPPQYPFQFQSPYAFSYPYGAQQDGSMRPCCIYCGLNNHKSEACFRQFPHLKKAKAEQKTNQ